MVLADSGHHGDGYVTPLFQTLLTLQDFSSTYHEFLCQMVLVDGKAEDKLTNQHQLKLGLDYPIHGQQVSSQSPRPIHGWYLLTVKQKVNQPIG